MNQSNSLVRKDEAVQWLSTHGDLLFRYALTRVGRTDTAEDLVQETFLSALRSVGDFEGRSKIETWLIGILRHKIADYLRKVARDRKQEVSHDGVTYAGLFRDGHWRRGLRRWSMDPSEGIENEEFWQVLEACQQKLPVTLASAFRMRDIEEMAMSEICDVLEITTTNLSVRLHRARVLLRECLDKNWFAARSNP